MPHVGEITLERMTKTIKVTKTIEEQAFRKLDDHTKIMVNKTIQKLFSVHRSVCYGQNRLEIKRLPR